MKKVKVNVMPYKRFLGFKWPDGWKDLGKQGAYYNESMRDHAYSLHGICKRRLRIAKFPDKLVKFCKRCEVEVD